MWGEFEMIKNEWTNNNLNESTLVLHKGYDRNLSYGQKRFCYYLALILSIIPLIGYSLPNTINVLIVWMGDISVDLTLFRFPGWIMAWILGGCVNVLEILSIYLTIWKSQNWISLLVLMAAISISGSFTFQDFANQIGDMKNEDIQSQRDAIKYWQSQIDAVDLAINSRRDQIEEDKRLNSVREKELEQGLRNRAVPDDYARRIRQANEAIESSLLPKREAYTDSLNHYKKELVKKRFQHGQIVVVGGKKGGTVSTIILSIIAEAMFVVCTFLVILLKNSMTIDKLKGYPSSGGNSKYRKKKEQSTEIEDRDHKENKEIKIRNKGFNNNGDGDDRELLKSQELIIGLYKEYKDRNLQINISRISKQVGRSRSWVYDTLYNYTDFKPRKA